MANDLSSLDRMATERVLAKRGLEAGPDPMLGQSIATSLGSSPDEIAAARALSKRSGLPPTVARVEPARAEREARLREIDLPTLPQRAPATAKALTDPELARVAHDDIENMSLIERYARDIGQSFERGKQINELGPLGAEALIGALSGAEADEGREFRIRQIQRQMANETDFGVDPGGVLGFFTGIPGATAEALPMMGSGIVASVEGGLVGGAGGAAVGATAGLAGGPAAPATVPAGAVAGFGTGYATGATLGLYIHSAKQEAGHSFIDLRSITDENGDPIDPKLAAGISLAVGTVAGGIEMFALGKLFEKIPGADRLTGAGMRTAAKTALGNPGFRRFAGQLVGTATGSAVTEGLTEGIQELIAIGGEVAGLSATGQGLDAFSFEAKDPETGEAIVLRGTDAVLARVLSATAQGAQMGAGVAASGRTARLVTDSERARSTLAKLPGIQRLTKASAESKLLERDPEAFKQHAKAVAEQTGIESVYIEPQAMREYFESIDPEATARLFEEIPALREQSEEIGRTGADVTIRLEDWLSHPELAEALSESVRFDPLDMTAKEALGFQEDLEREVGSVQELAGAAKEADQARALVAREVKAQLLKVYPETVAAPLVELTMARYETRAQRLGVPLAELVEREGLFKIQGPQGPDEVTGALPESLEERLGALRDENRIRSVVGDLRAGKRPEVTRGTPIVDLLRTLGGVRKDSVLAGELRSMGFKPGGKGSFRGLISDKGRVDPVTKARREPIGDLDNLVAEEHPELAAVVGVDPETGYLDRQGLLDELSRELRGESRVVDPDEAAAVSEAQREQDLVREALEAAGLDLDADDAAIVQAVRGREFNQPVIDEEAAARAFESAKENMGTTEDVREAGFILPDGTLLDFSGKREGGESGVRHMDHRQIRFEGQGDLTGTDKLEAFQALGALRIDGGFGFAEIITTPTSAQVRRLVQLAQIQKTGSIFVEFGDGTENGMTLSSKEIPAAVRRGVKTFREANRGAIRMTDDLAEVVIRFTEAADLSTFLHESGHLYLAQLIKDAGEAGGQLSEDVETIRSVFAPIGQDLFSDEVQENWARAFEAYLFEGKSPSLKLDRVFARFQAWLVRIYKRLRGIPGYQNNLTPEIREVMDRLIATDEQIAEAQEARGFLALTPESLGLTPEQAAEYERRVEAGRDEARRKLQIQLMNQLERQKSREWKSLREGVRAEVEADVNARPVFRAAQWIALGKALEGQPIPIVPHAKLDRAALVELYGPEIRQALPTKYHQAKDGLHPDYVAELFGFQTGDDLVRSLQAAGDRLEVIESETDALMKKRHGTLQTSEQLEHAALEALLNDKQVKALETAERAVAAKAGGKVIPIKLLRASAQRIVGNTRYRDLVPGKYRAAASKASREAIKLIASGDFPGAQIALRHQITNLLMESEARKRIEKSDRGADYLNRVQSKKRWARIGLAGADYQEQIEGLLARFDLRKHQSLRQIDRLKGFAAWLGQQEAIGETVIVPPKLRDEAFRTSWKELTVDDFDALVDSVRNLEHLAKRKLEFSANRDKRNRDEVRSELVAAIGKNATHRDLPNTLNPTRFEGFKRGLLAWDSILIKMEHLADFLDGGDPNGPWRTHVINPINDLTEERLVLSKQFTEAFGDMIREFVKPRLTEYTTLFYSPEIGTNLNKLETIMVLLNLGNDGNLQRLQDGNRISERSAIALIDRVLEPQDIEFAKRMWKLADSFFPLISDQKRKMVGVNATKVPPRTIATRFGEIEGGYFPIIYDPGASLISANQLAESAFGGGGLGISFVDLEPGSAHDRLAKVTGRPLHLDMSVIPAHFDELIHKLTARERLTQVHRLLESGAIRDAFKETTLGVDYFNLWKKWIEDIASDRIVENRALGKWSRFFRHVRLGQTVGKLALRATTIVGQVWGHSNAAGMLADHLPNWRTHYAFGARRVMSNLSPRKFAALANQVMEDSDFMGFRLYTRDRDVQDIHRRAITSKANLSGRFLEKATIAADLSMAPIGLMQWGAVDLPVWIAAYEGAQVEFDMDHDGARRFADSMVRMSQGGGSVKDLSQIQRADESVKMWTVFMGYLNTAYQQVAFTIRASLKTRDTKRAIRGVFFYFLFPTFAMAMTREVLTGRGGPPDDADDWLDYMKWAIGVGISEAMNLVPFAREASGVPAGLLGSGRYFGSETPFQDMIDKVNDAANSQDDAETVFDVIRLTSPLLGGFPPEAPTNFVEDLVREE